MRTAFPASIVLLLSVIGGGASAGVTLTMETDTGGPPRTSTMLVDADRMKQDTDHGAIIYRGDLQKFWALNDAKHSYVEMTPQSMQQMQAQMDAVMQRMQQQMQSMPPEQRKQIEAMMAQHGAGTPPAAAAPSPPPTIAYDKLGPDTTIGAWSCTPYRMTVNDRSHEEMCIARQSDLGLTRDDLAVFASMSAFMQKLKMPMGGSAAAEAAAIDPAAMAKAIGFDGFPIRTTEFSPDGKQLSQTTIKAVERKTLAPGTFDLPAGYARETMSMGGRPTVVEP
ncbi:MAG TPA: DUF4412 domain-containing protein [Stellaceae bacterium]|nr:DUF4412 domain-containing protein [Stellaceae bacterium]